jgi:hypothetical protein
MTKKVKEIVDRIESDFRELAEETKVNHISAFMIGGRFYIDDYDHLDDKRKSKFMVEGKVKTDE